MKTPIQQLIDIVGYGAQGLNSDELYDLFMEEAEEMLEKEKSAIQQAFYEGMLCQGFDPNMGRAEVYYNEVYKNNEKIRKFQETSKEFDKLVEQGLAERRGNRLLSTSDAHLKRQVWFNVKIEDDE